MLTWLILGLSLLSGILYRMGGTSKGTKWRDLGIPCVVTIYMLTLGIKVVWWAYLLHFGLLFGALTAYYGLDEEKFGYWAHGLGLSLAAIPLYWTGVHWWAIGIRGVVLTVGITIVSEYISKDWLEEGLRGALICLTLPFLMI